MCSYADFLYPVDMGFGAQERDDMLVRLVFGFEKQRQSTQVHVFRSSVVVIVGPWEDSCEGYGENCRKGS